MKILVSGIKPTGIPTLGNYIGALKPFVKLQEELKDVHFFVFVADLHALTVYNEPSTLRANARSVAALLLASGLKEENLTLFIQSEVYEHNQLGYVFEGLSYIGELKRMTQFKDKVAKKSSDAASASLFTYPSLMAADILLYDADFVPMGSDQKQHLEITKTLAQRFNNRYSETFKYPEAIIPKVGERIMNLQDPTKKMSKSETGDDKGCIFLLDTLDTVKKKIKSAVTDNEKTIKYDPKNRPGISNLLTIYSALTNLSFKELEKKYLNKGYQEFKSDLAEIVAHELNEVQNKYQELIKSKKLDDILDCGALEAHKQAQRKIEKVYRKIGILRKKANS